MHVSGAPFLSFTFEFVAFAATFFYPPDLWMIRGECGCEDFYFCPKRREKCSSHCVLATLYMAFCSFGWAFVVCLPPFKYFSIIEHYIGDACILSNFVVHSIVWMYDVHLFGCTLMCIL